MNTRRLKTSLVRVSIYTGLLLLAAGRTAAQAPAASDCRPLPQGAGAEYNIGAEERQCFRFELQPAELFQVRVEQKGIDLLLRLLDAGGKELAQMNSPNGKDGPEVLTYVAAGAGVYVLEVGPHDPKGGGGAYAVRREEARAATERDRRRVEVERMLAEGMAARGERTRLALAIEKLSGAEAGWRELGEAYMAEITARKVTQAKAVAAFRDGQAILSISRTPDSLRAAAARLREAGRLFREADDKHGEAGSLLGLATVAYLSGEKAESLMTYKQALALYRVTNDRMELSQSLGSIATITLELGDRKSGLEYMEEALPIYEEVGDEGGVAGAENFIGSLYYGQGKYDLALKHLNRALELRQKFNNKCDVAATMNNRAVVYSALGEKARALALLSEQTLPLFAANTECVGFKALTLTNIGKIYNDLGEYARGLKYQEEALKLSAGDVDKGDEAAIRANIGAAHYGAGEYVQALASYEVSLRLFREAHVKEHEATLLTDIGVVQTAQGKYADALGTFEKAMALRLEVGDPGGEAITLNNIGENYMASGDGPRALEYFKQSLTLFRVAGDRSGEAAAFGNAMTVSRRLGNRRMAIFYGKQAVNNFQELRGAARVRDHEIQRNYLRLIRGSYQTLAELLLEEGLYEQAVHVLNLYQDQQFFDFDRPESSKVSRAGLTGREQRLAYRYAAAGAETGAAASRLEEFRRQFSDRRPTADEAAQLSRFEGELKTASGAPLAVLKEAEAELARPPDATEPAADLEDVENMKTTLHALENEERQKEKAAALYTLVGSERLYVLLVTADGFEAFSNPVKAAEVNAAAERLHAFLREPGFPAFKSAAAVYDIIFNSTSTRRAGVTLASEIEGRKPDILLWSLDGALNYISVAALYDARRRQYLVEKYQNVVFTRSDGGRLLRESRPWTSGIGFGKSDPSAFRCGDEETARAGVAGRERRRGPERHEALEFVQQELATIFLGGPGRPALVPGRVLLGPDFSRASMVDSLKGKDVPLVHIASHFCFQPGDAENSFLLLGDNKRFPLFEMKEYRDLFQGVDLLVLSACQTASLQPSSKTGREIDSLAELSQRLGANSVIATLWDASDAGAGKLMIEFYRLRAESPQLSKAELLRRAQLSLLRGETRQPGLRLTHPTYWSAFVLYGSFR
jgi:CHAT domain-containing protein